MTPELFGYGHAGPPSPACEIKLVDVPEANYFSTNETPQGEVWIRGAPVTKGYWKRDDLTSEILADGGWLQTGDIGEWKKNGALAVIDRKKNLVKLSNGEYIALEKLESIYKSCVVVGNICIYADSLLPRAVALVVPAEKALYALAKEKDVTEKDWNLLCGDSTIKNAVLAALGKQGKDAGLKPNEMLFDVYLCSEEWTTENVSIMPATWSF
jgi:long-chain acyl-CoA synthetase